MKVFTVRGVSCAAFLLGFALASPAATVNLDFESLFDPDPVGTAYASLGATFTNAVVWTAGISLNEVDFPPRSGSNVAVDLNGPIEIVFATPISSFSAYFTYSHLLHLTAFDASNAVRSAISAFSENFVSSGNSPNEQLSVSYSPGFNRIVIEGDPVGPSFAMDDVSYETASLRPVPEPAVASLTLLGLFAGALLRRLRSSQRARTSADN